MVEVAILLLMIYLINRVSNQARYVNFKGFNKITGISESILSVKNILCFVNEDLMVKNLVQTKME